LVALLSIALEVHADGSLGLVHEGGEFSFGDAHVSVAVHAGERFEHFSGADAAVAVAVEHRENTTATGHHVLNFGEVFPHAFSFSPRFATSAFKSSTTVVHHRNIIRESR